MSEIDRAYDAATLDASKAIPGWGSLAQPSTATPDADDASEFKPDPAHGRRTVAMDDICPDEAPAASTDTSGALVKVLRPLLGAHSDVTANHILASDWLADLVSAAATRARAEERERVEMEACSVFGSHPRGRHNDAVLAASADASGALSEACPCGCPRDMHIDQIGCPCGLPDEPPCAAGEINRPPAWTIPADLCGGPVSEWIEVLRLDHLAPFIAARESAAATRGLTVCDQPHGHEGNPARVYGHFGSRRTCIRIKATDEWVYDPAWEATDA